MNLQQDLPAPQTLAPPINDYRLILATNRGPIEYSLSRDNVLHSRRGAGGVVTALMSAEQSLPVTWIAMAMTDGDRLMASKAHRFGQLLQVHFSRQRWQLHYVDIPMETYHQYYDKVSNQVLWFLQHYLSHPDDVTSVSDLLRDAWEHGYCQANQAIARAICAEIEREQAPAVVMLHDYHLYLAPRFIRQSHPGVVMQQFIHIPWPAIRYWQSFLPHALLQDIYRGLVANDILGFQTRRDAYNFLEGARVVLSDADVDIEEGKIIWNTRCTLVRDYPISISVSNERRLLRSAEAKQAVEKIYPYLGKQTIMRVDRIEPTKNLVQGFRAYQYLLETHPEVRGEVTFLALLVPSRQTVPRYQHYQEEVFRTVEHINSQYASEGWVPIHVIVENNRTQALAALQFYDVLLVNPWIDGMNLVAKEGPVVNQRNGVLVLSRTAGAFQQLGKAAVPTSPGDVVETAEALYTALTLPPGVRRLKARLAQCIIERHDLKEWFTRQRDDISHLITQPFKKDKLASTHNSPGGIQTGKKVVILGGSALC